MGIVSNVVSPGDKITSQHHVSTTTAIIAGYLCKSDKHKILYDSHYSFRDSRSVLHALLDVTTPVYDEIQKIRHTGLMLMD